MLDADRIHEFPTSISTIGLATDCYRILIMLWQLCCLEKPLTSKGALWQTIMS